MNTNALKWFYLILLSVIWGSSFILIEMGLEGLTDYQVGSLRIVLTALFLFAVGFKSVRQIRKKHWLWIIISGFVSSFFPPFLFAIAQSHIDSGIAAILNSFTPLATVVVGVLMFRILTTRRQNWGVLVGLIGTILIILAGEDIQTGQNYWYSGLIILATFGYALNVNIIKKYLADISALAVTTGNFIFIVVPAFAILYATGFFETIMESKDMQVSFMYVALLSLIGTAFAKVVFNRLIQIASPVFASSVTYTMPIVAVIWGLIVGEKFNFLQAFAALVIMAGVYLANKRKKDE